MLKITDLSVKYNAPDTAFALRDISFSARPGERVALVGANGAGKSTLLLAICGVLGAASGHISVCDIPVEKKTLADLRRKVGVIFQNPDDQLFMPGVYEDVAFGPRNYGVEESEIERRAGDVLSRLQISHLKDRMTHKLSGGEKRLAALAGVLVMEPALLLLDEPTTFLDHGSRRRLIEILKGLPQTMLLATHDLDMAFELCGRVILLKDGALLADCPAEALRRNKRLLEECGLELRA